MSILNHELSTVETTTLRSDTECVVFEPINYANDGYSVFVCEADQSETGIQMGIDGANDFANTLIERGLIVGE